MSRTHARKAEVGPLDYQEFGNRVGHHRTAPRGVDPEGEFLQVLKRRRDRNGLSAQGPTVLLLHFNPVSGITAFWFGGDDLALAVQLAEECESIPSERWDEHIYNATVRFVYIDSGARNLKQLINRYDFSKSP